MKKYLVVLFGIFVLLFTMSFLQASSIPSDWWGTVMINGEYANGTEVEAYIDNLMVASAIVGAIQPNYYLIHVLGKSGDLIQFKINGRNTENDLQVWVFGSNRLDLVVNMTTSPEIRKTSHSNIEDWGEDICEPSWRCGGWSSCDDGRMTRTCYDASHCDYSYNEPNEVAGCGISEHALVEGEDNQIYVVAFLGVLSVVSLIVLVSVLSKK